MDNLVVRVEALESQLRRWRMLALLGVIVLTMVLLTGAASPERGGLWQPPANSLASRSFVLVGNDGSTVYARLTARDGKPVLNFYDQAGRVVWSAPPKVTTKPLDTK